ncbi:hypothetical protein BT96DRAFT_353696 [Gymnopus androsaceus JB14]|uniref:Fatty acid desaturase domain-containing protein n=1 Tax=Gymnopus androsaceus JB14 TaxID=1447944 RepID=A0A6A4GYU5_9AGAR|nr:hypothetical protein BT96DRAFT_353696 [Gymnopus androsaceus JB14]
MGHWHWYLYLVQWTHLSSLLSKSRNSSAKRGCTGQRWIALSSTHSTHSTHSKVAIYPELWIAMSCYGLLWISHFTAHHCIICQSFNSFFLLSSELFLSLARPNNYNKSYILSD